MIVTVFYVIIILIFTPSCLFGTFLYNCERLRVEAVSVHPVTCVTLYAHVFIIKFVCRMIHVCFMCVCVCCVMVCMCVCVCMAFAVYVCMCMSSVINIDCSNCVFRE